jgi:hypothetical protein
VTVATLQAAQHRLNEAIESAALALEHERQQLTKDPAIRAAYDQGRIDECTRIASMIGIRLDQLSRNTVESMELRLLRDAVLEAALV